MISSRSSFQQIAIIAALDFALADDEMSPIVQPCFGSSSMGGMDRKKL